MVFNASCAIHKGILNDLNDASHVDQRCIKPHFSQLAQRLICHKQQRRIVNTSDLGAGHPCCSGGTAATFFHFGKNQSTRLWILENQVDLAIGTPLALSQQMAASIAVEICNAMLCCQSRMKCQRTAHSCLPKVNAI